MGFSSLLAMLAMVKNPEAIIDATKNSLFLCAKTLVPSVFPFMAVASLFINFSSGNNYKALGSIFNLVFGTSSYAMYALIPGMLCGYPVGASCVCELYKKNVLSKSEAESLIAYSNNSGPLFIIGAIGIGMLGSAKYGTMLYAIHITSALICGIILKPFTRQMNSKIEITIPAKDKNFCDCISDASLNILKICGFVVIFGVINKLLEPIIIMLPTFLKCIVSGFLELTNGAFTITHTISNNKNALVLLSAILGWSGMSVHMQVKNIISDTDLSMKKYYISRMVSCIISAMISLLVFKKPQGVSSIQRDGIPYGIMIIISVAIIIFAIMADHKKNIKRT